MNHVITPLPKQTLADNLASELKKFIINNRYYPGKKLPSTSELAKNFGVGMPTLREAIKKLETLGAIVVKHGSGIFVGENINSVILVNPITSNEIPTKKQLLDLIEARMSIEFRTAELAAKNATPANIEEMKNLLNEASHHLNDDTLLIQINGLFHQAIASASGNTVFEQILGVISKLFQIEQRSIIEIFKFRKTDYEQHVEILKAIEKHNVRLCINLMRSHLEGVHDAIQKWNAK